MTSTQPVADAILPGDFQTEAEFVRAEHIRRGAYGPSPFTRDLDLDLETLIEGCRARLALLLEDESFRVIGDRTLISHETVRRHLRYGTIGFRFVLMATRAYGLSAEWVLFGTGPRFLRDVKGAVVGESTLTELQEAVAVRTSILEHQVRELHDRLLGEPNENPAAVDAESDS